MVINPENNIYNIGNSFEERRGCSLSFSMHKPKSPSISSSKYFKDYHVRVKKNSDRMDKDEPVGSIGSVKVEYASQRGQKDQVSKATDTTNDTVQ